MIIRPKAQLPNTTIGIDLPFSKSISNRLLIMNALSTEKVKIDGLSESDDTRILESLLPSPAYELNAGMAGTAYRFMLAYLCVKGEKHLLTGHQRMLERPIGPLVNALNELGAKIEYLNRHGYPPISILPSNLKGGEVRVNSSISSQFISALMMIAPQLEGGLKISFDGPVVSWPYVKMTADLMSKANISVQLSKAKIEVQEGEYDIVDATRVEKDWSSAAFFYSVFALSNLKSLKLNAITIESVQGDQQCTTIFQQLGVKTEPVEGGLLLSKMPISMQETELDMNDVPDLILPFVTAASFMLSSIKVKGISTLFHKESNRVEALQKELSKFGVNLTYDEHHLHCTRQGQIPKNVSINHYNDHRIAMCFAVLAALGVEIEMNNGSVVNKSFPRFWKELDKILAVDHSLF